MRKALIGLVVLLLVGALGATAWALLRPEPDPFERYCDEVVARRATISDAIAQGETTGLLAALPQFEELQDVAPRDIRDEWDTVVDSIRELRDALEEAGVDPADYDREHPPSGLTADEKDAIDAAAIGIGSEAMRTALAGVAQQARDVCRSPLWL